MHDLLTLGIDVGSTSLSAVVLGRGGEVHARFSTAHEGDIPAALNRLDALLQREIAVEVFGCAATGRLGEAIRHDLYVDSRLATIRSARRRYPEARAILLVGGEQFCLIRFDSEGGYHSVRTNTSCAAGTGGFLDQQADRLCLADSAELSRLAVSNRDPVPLVATRCAVFAKTDLIHAQQEGYSVSAIGEGLCRGLARNIADTLFKDADLEGPVLFTGGVSCNQAVCRAIRSVVPLEIIVDGLGQYQGAIGAALSLFDGVRLRTVVTRPAELYAGSTPDRSTFSAPLLLRHSDYPDFVSYRSYEYATETGHNDVHGQVVEVDLYRAWPSVQDAYLGIDIGSTSTKAVITALDGQVQGGFYTRTAGRPLRAVQGLFEAIDNAAGSQRCSLAIHGSATTGSGRKFIGKLINADEVMDEISAHARAACELNPDVDTIIEIGGQDAKFTTLRDGRVTFSVMNNVCAAGTGSFLEEQARRLGVAVRDYQRRTEGVRAPLVSNRCTVFMERDINHLLATGHSVDEVLAAAVHAVRENYLHKVAVERSIGDVVFFQGATARNRALVAAFEQRLNRPILVSPWCHLTGALGAALTLADAHVLSDGFVGLELYRRSIPLRREVCTLCTNHCKLTVADLEERSVAFGFLCGRDYQSDRYVNCNRSGFDLLHQRRALDRRLRAAETARGTRFDAAAAGRPLIGLPDALFMSADLEYWQLFFEQLGLPTRTSGGMRDATQRGKPLAGAEFCAPVSALYGHAAALLENVDYLFLPVYLEEKPGSQGELRKYCYYSQYVSALVAQGVDQRRVLSPLVASRYSGFHLIGELLRALAVLPAPRPGVRRIAAALECANEFRRRREAGLCRLYRDHRSDRGTVDVVLLGRPYTVLQPAMNKGIPDTLAAMGIRVFYQDMLHYDEQQLEAIQPLLREVNWFFAATILKAAEVAARTPGLYPVMLTSFKCGPDSFISEYLKRIMDAHDKPYLILELDDHDSRVGYETRIEAALRSFRNHLALCGGQSGRPAAERGGDGYRGVNPRYHRQLPRDRTLVLPNWDGLAIPLIAAILNSHGYPAAVMQETDETIRRSLRWNSGQCIPMNALVEGFVRTVERLQLQPERSALWVPTAEFSCNIRLFPHHIQEILSQYQHMQQAVVYLGNMTFIELSPLVTANAYLAYMFSGLLRRIACRIRPYEHHAGQTDRAVTRALAILQHAFSDSSNSKSHAVAEIIDLFETISYDERQRRPKVALFGDVYVRDNDVMNQDVIGYIERNGGEVVTMPFHEFTRMTCDVYFRRWGREGKLGRLLTLKPMMAALTTMERWYYRRFERVVGAPLWRYNRDPAGILASYGVRLEHEGESQDNLLKTWYIKQQHPDLALFIQLNPAFCCAGLVTEAMSARIQQVTGVPVLTVTYDGTGGFKNDAILPYLTYPATPGRVGRSPRGAAGNRSYESPVA
ncbi:MAG: CoA activase [Spirochaetaceae bacterium]|nr:MAG: CoA activase [Spirochaetaceae bacterium]